jgi:hypothetical protein
MRTLSDKFRMSNNIGVIITTPLYNQACAYAEANNTSISTTIRDALEHYLNNADTIKPPTEAQISTLRRTKEVTDRFQRDRTVNIVINPVKFPQLRDRLDIYARANQLMASTVLRRAIYEYTKPTHTHTPDPVATLDGWIDTPIRVSEG